VIIVVVVVVIVFTENKVDSPGASCLSARWLLSL